MANSGHRNSDRCDNRNDPKHQEQRLAEIPWVTSPVDEVDFAAVWIGINGVEHSGQHIVARCKR